jgi:hypothetical protein
MRVALKRILRFLFAIVAVMSMVLGLCILLLWIRSVRHEDAVVWEIDTIRWGGHFDLASGWGQVGLCLDSDFYPAAFSLTSIVRGHRQGPTPLDSKPFYQSLPNDPVWQWVGYTTDPYSVYTFGLYGSGPGRRDWEWAHFDGDYFSGTNALGKRWNVSLVVPHWFAAILCMILPAAWFRGVWRQWRAALTGHCRRCHYDLTANLSGVCPECGMPIVEQAENSKGSGVFV